MSPSPSGPVGVPGSAAGGSAAGPPLARLSLGEQVLQARPLQPPEGPVHPVPGQHRYFQLGGADLRALAIALLTGEGGDGHSQRASQREALGIALLEHGRHLIGLATHGDEAVFVRHRPVEGDPVYLVGLRCRPDLGDHDLDLVRLGAVGEDRAQELRVPVGQAAGRHVGPVVLVAPHVGVADPGDAQVLVLVVPAHRRERDPVVDLADLVQRTGRVRRDEQDPRVVLDHDAVAAACDALARVVGLVFHRLFWRHVERHRHRWDPYSCGRLVGLFRLPAGSWRVVRVLAVRPVAGQERRHRAPRGPHPLVDDRTGVFTGLGV